MPLDDRQRFKFGFLAACADRGLTPAETAAAVKAAEDGWVDTGRKLLSAVTPPAKAMLDFAVNKGPLTMVLGSAGLGAAGGALAAKLVEKPADPEEARKQELIAAYNAFTDHVRGHAALPPQR